MPRGLRDLAKNCSQDEGRQDTSHKRIVLTWHWSNEHYMNARTNNTKFVIQLCALAYHRTSVCACGFIFSASHAKPNAHQ
jgi:hypothetical protein